MSRLLAGELVRLGHPRPAHAADQLLLLIDGASAEQILARRGNQDDPAYPTRLAP
ncbi:hypothetical protein [Streptomyces sp. NK08204]|uniref:hypothetical protein n=1 Tax=Streptomyces sp. NK08204 TaxID=2873260 RepID=UPI001CECC3F3|nr:hypothetical protein [Streptomyces sp. NK08204]